MFLRMTAEHSTTFDKMTAPGCDLQTQLVVLIHGLAANRWLLVPLQHHLRNRGFSTFNWPYRSVRRSIDFNSGLLERELRRLDTGPEFDAIHLVTHSMGGIITRHALRRFRPQKLGRIVMLGPPNHGSKVARVLSHGLGFFCPPLAQLSDAPQSFVNSLPEPSPDELGEIGIVAAMHDRVVRVDSTRLAAERDFRTVPSGHTSMLFRKDVAQAAAHFLLNGQFPRNIGKLKSEEF